MAYGNNAKTPSGVVSSDKNGMKSEPMRQGVAQGMQDKTKQFNTGKNEAVCYSHDRKSCQ